MSDTTIAYRFAVDYLDGAGQLQRDVFETREQAERRVDYLAERGRGSLLRGMSA